jgi:hypothetical protein
LDAYSQPSDVVSTFRHTFAPIFSASLGKKLMLKSTVQYFANLETNAGTGASLLVGPARIPGEVLMRQFWIHASFTLFGMAAIFTPAAQAQHRGGMAAGGAAVAPARTAPAPALHTAAGAGSRTSLAAQRVGAAVHTPARTSVGAGGRVPVGGAPIRVASQGRHINTMSGLSILPSFATSFGNAPGLGFDFPHMAAVNSGRGFGRGHSRFNNGFGFGGFLLSPEVVVVPSENAQTAPDDEAAANIARNGDNNDRNLQDQFLPDATRLGPPAPVRDASEYVFVRRDGALLFGVAYSWDNGTLRYITREGQRRSVSQDALDMDATQQFNEQRGVNFHTPA